MVMKTTVNRFNMDMIDVPSVIENMGIKARQVVQAYNALSQIETVDVGTAPKTEVFARDKLKLYRFNRETKPTCQTPTLIVYALVNRPYMLDLQPDRSMIRNLLEHGMDIFLIDWGYADRTDRYLTMDDYINGYIDDCVEAIHEVTGHEQVNLVGICQGGTFSTIYAALHPEKVKTLTTLVTPIDFETNESLLFRWSKDMNVDTIVDAYGGMVPADFMNIGFLMLKPFARLLKYVDFLERVEDRDKLLNFLRMEKWIFDSPDQAGECYRQFIKDLFQQNKLIQNTLVVGDHKVDLKKITMPLLNIFASRDHIVPPVASKPLNDLVGSTDTQLYEFNGGHIGLFVSSRTQRELAPAMAEWLHERDA